MDSSIFERTTMALHMLISNAKQLQCDCSDKRKQITPLVWLREFATVSIRGPRQTGHSTAAAVIAEYRFKNSLIIYPTSNIEQKMKNFLSLYERNIESDFLGNPELLRGRQDNIPGCVILDVFSMMPQAKVNNIEHILAGYGLPIGFCLIQVG